MKSTKILLTEETHQQILDILLKGKNHDYINENKACKTNSHFTGIQTPEGSIQRTRGGASSNQGKRRKDSNSHDSACNIR